MRSADDIDHALTTEWRGQDAPTLAGKRAAIGLKTPRLDPRIRNPVERMMAFDALTYLPDGILTKVDRAAMS